MLFTCSKKKTKSDSAISYSIAPTFIQASVPSLNFKTTLGPLDTLFTNVSNVSSVFVELLLIFNKSSINPSIFQQAVSNALTDFPSMCGRRIGTTIAGAQGVRFSAITTSLNSLISKPPSKDIFDTPLENEVVTLRLATTEHNEMSGIGLVFDHALSDISGIALLLSHISYQYVELTSKMTEDVNTCKGKVLPSCPEGTVHALHIKPGTNSLQNALKEAKIKGITEIYLEEGMYTIDLYKNEYGKVRNYVEIDFPVSIIGQSKDGCKIIGGLLITGKKEDNVYVKDLTFSNSIENGVCGDKRGSFHLDNVCVEKSGSFGVSVNGTTRNTMNNCVINCSKWSGLLVWGSGLMTIDGTATNIHHNATSGENHHYGLCTDSSSDAIHLRSLTIEQISTQNSGGGNCGGQGTLKTIETILPTSKATEEQFETKGTERPPQTKPPQTKPPQTKPPLPPASNNRNEQSNIQIEPRASNDTTTTNNNAPSKNQRLKGGVACVEFIYTTSMLQQLKLKYKARSRHEAAFTDLILLLRNAGCAPLSSATISRDDRIRSGMHPHHIGNGITLTQADFEWESKLNKEQNNDGTHIAAALRQAIQQGIGKHPLSKHEDLHLNTWWHPLQKSMHFGFGTQPFFAIGPGSLAAASQICVVRNGQPNVTILPAGTNGSSLSVSLLAPLNIGHGVLKQIKHRLKEERKAAKARGEVMEVVEQPKNIYTDSTKTKEKKEKKEKKDTKPVEQIQGAIVFLHGLGDAKCIWDRRFSSAAKHINGGFHQPIASNQSVTAHKGKIMPSWFNIPSLPISISSNSLPDGLMIPNGLSESIEQIHRLLDELSLTVPCHRIILAGFSQGGALAIQSGLTYKKGRLAGIVSMSGWVICPDVLKNNCSVPIFFSSGTSDPTVDYELSKSSCDMLIDLYGKETVHRHVIQRGKHSPKGKEVTAAGLFMQEVLQ